MNLLLIFFAAMVSGSFGAFFRKTLSLTADPPTCTVPATGGFSAHKLVNEFGFVDPFGSKDIVITRTAGAPNWNDKLVIHYAPAPADATDAQAAFAAATLTGQALTIPLTATA
ncbi:MSP domain-containing protein [Caenorhabditis elegans]|uniref:MSP domain-containing protein n=1 Tax=Caenorhabditis elegans TaxID=6239 RepID=Q9XVH1_CAEEL|nr:MSP domain-containing protein [Caenorhabditis elegans]CAB03462.1 MSP domain-containing protein [Caenorhabditis elegans]|eukprot:NP_493185.1 Sperm Specific family, class P [Caenorhabditis elegans]